MEGGDRLTPLDASFLHLEDGRWHMHVAAVLVFEGEPPPYESFLEHVESRLHLVPRYRQRLATVPLAQARPRWVDDERFDLRYHVRPTALARPGGEDELRALAGRVFSHPLNRQRPLWELWLVEGLSGRRFAVISKTHHAVVDGIAGADVIEALFDPGERGERQSWRPSKPPGGIELLAEALVERLTVPAEAFRFVRSLVRTPERVARQALGSVAGLAALARSGLSPSPASPYNRGTVGPDRRVTWVRASLDEFKQMKDSMDGKLNDAVLTVVTRALRRHLTRRGEPLQDVDAFVPVSVRSEDARGQQGNEVAGMIVTLPLGCEDPKACFQAIARSTQQAKASGQAMGAKALTDLGGFAPATILDQAARLTARQRFMNLVVTNVPGPQRPLGIGGNELLEMFPLVPLGGNLNLGVAILSYNRRLCFGLTGDFDAMPDIDALARDFEDAIAELGTAAGVQAQASRRLASV